MKVLSFFGGVALHFVLSCVKVLGPKSDFSKRVFFEVLKLMPPVPNIPGASIFYQLGTKMVGYFVDFAVIKDGKVFLTYRDDQFYKGWHFPGFCRTPRTELLADCQRAINRELGNGVIVHTLQSLHQEDRVNDPRAHHISNLMLVEFSGDPIGKEGKGKWFSSMPKDMLSTQICFWPHIEHLLYE